MKWAILLTASYTPLGNQMFSLKNWANTGPQKISKIVCYQNIEGMLTFSILL